MTNWTAGGTFNDATLNGWRAEGAGTGGWSTPTEQDSGGHAEHADSGAAPAYLVSTTGAAANVRAEADLRVTAAGGAAGLTLGYAGPGDRITAWLDRGRGALVTEVTVGGVAAGEQVTALPAGFTWNTWHNVSAELRGTALSVEVSHDRLHDPVAVQQRTVPAGAARGGAVGLAARGPGAAGDNVGAATLHTPVTSRVATPVPGALLPAYSDEFDAGGVPGTTAGSPWSWVRGPAAGATAGGGQLAWPTQDAELYLGTNTASVLLRDAPQGDYTVETEIHFAPGQASQQAGLVLYENDDRWFKLVHSVLPLNNGGGALLNVSEFGKEGEAPTTTPPTAVANAPMFGGPTADTLWLRLARHLDTAHQENEVRAATSRDGVHWVYGGVWTLPVRGALKIGLVSMNRSGATARFDYLRTYQG